MRLKAKMLLAFTPLLLLGGVLIVWLTGRAVHRALIEEVALRGLTSMQEAGMRGTIAAAFVARDENRLLAGLQTMRLGAGADYAMALDPLGEVVAHTNVAEKGKVYDDPATREALDLNDWGWRVLSGKGEELLDVSMPVWREDTVSRGEEYLLSPPSRTRIGTLRLGLGLGEAAATEYRIRRRVAGIIGWIGMLLLAAGGLLLVDILRPIRALTAGTSLVAGGDYVKVPVHTKDELGDLANNFNRMSEALARTTVSKGYLDAILANMLDPLIVVRSNGTIRTANRAALTLTGLPERELLGIPAERLAAESDRDGFRSDVLERLLRGETIHSLELALTGKGGRPVPVLLSGSPLIGPDGRPAGVVLVAKDITELKRAQAELARSNTELERFAYAASHDLQEPLRKVGGFTQILAMRYQGRLDEDADRYMASIVKGVARMQTLIRDLLRYSRTGRGEPATTDVDLNEVLRGVLSDLDQAIHDKKATIESDRLPTVQANSSEMRQLLQNLIDNAVKFCRQGGCRVKVRVRETTGGWEIAVQDNGIGIDPRYAGQLFVMFKRLHPQSEYPGTGIGLAICKKIVERYGGRIWLVSELGRGSTFYFTLPVKTLAAAATRQKG